MAELQQFHVDQFTLKLNPACYIVEVATEEGEAHRDSLTSLPKWVFESKHTIWLADEQTTIAERARKGETLRQQLLQILNLLLPHPRTA
ncbi:MAG: hypothetical protein C5B54_04915 [Acidobacteria bacterium]|nr:MAG: hypothetical protein C5B54_04915 [Acidobacteriota bacterium]